MRTRSKIKIWFGILAVWAAGPLLVYGQEFNLSPTFAGHAVALQVEPVIGPSVALSETGPVPAAGGQREGSLLDAYPVEGISAHELYAVTLGASSVNRSQASLAYLDAKVGSHHVTAQWVESEATATHQFLNVPTSGKSTLEGLMVDGQTIAVSGEANQTINFSDGYLVINEQTGSNSRQAGTITVNALHLFVNGEGSLIAASSTAEVVNSPTRGPSF